MGVSWADEVIGNAEGACAYSLLDSGATGYRLEFIPASCLGDVIYDWAPVGVLDTTVVSTTGAGSSNLAGKPMTSL